MLEKMSTLLPPAGQDQQEFFLHILQMSSEELSDRLRERDLSDEGNKAAKQAVAEMVVAVVVVVVGVVAEMEMVVHLYAVPQKDADTTARVLLRYFSQYGLADTVRRGAL